MADTRSCINSATAALRLSGFARDTRARRQVAVKVLTADASADPAKNELKVREWLKDHESRGGGGGVLDGSYFVSNVDQFVLQGPNGTHVCIVTDVVGPSLRELILLPGAFSSNKQKSWPQRARDLAGQATKGVVFPPLVWCRTWRLETHLFPFFFPFDFRPFFLLFIGRDTKKRSYFPSLFFWGGGGKI